ncbi:MAG: methylenetetrahydrofolate reductase [NAD(P)H] [Nevskiaceae bacterium]|nr:MAG: methylenetetrahydrofolate reductase [NAD(P)H] [Nevskiaceae bacterium]TBR75120.1 MAG: methylenetetrahydrofolate reductase [NAD(P)H] [Nevskiaceae bacterium]
MTFPDTELSFSFELFPPRTPAGVAKLPAVVAQLSRLDPAYFSVTYGAGGSTQTGTYETLMQVAEHTGVPVAAHLTCVGSTRVGIRALLDQYRTSGIRRIVALRGDLPATAAGSEAPGEFHYAADLVRFVRETHGDHFTIEVAAYPEMHPQATDPDADFQHFCDKMQAGADGAVTQYFYTAGSYFHFVERACRAGVKASIVPGIMPITNGPQLLRFSAACGADVPRWIRLRLEHYGEDRESVQAFGLDVVTRLCNELLDGGAPGLHVYTLNQSAAALALWRSLGLAVPDPD